MNIQYISDSSGNTTGVFIPINEWNELKNKYMKLALEAAVESSDLNAENADLSYEHSRNNAEGFDWDDVISDIEKGI